MGIARLNVCVCIVVSYYNPLFFCSSFDISYFLLKSSDLSMVNPHISLNLWNPLIHGAILRFSKDFYCEIHGFHWQSSDLAVDLSKSSGRSEEFIYFVWVSVWWSGQWLPFTQSVCPTDKLRPADGCFWELDLSEHRSEHRSENTDLCWVSFLYFSTLFIPSHHEILMFGVQSSDFLVNPWVNPQIVWIS